LYGDYEHSTDTDKAALKALHYNLFGLQQIGRFGTVSIMNTIQDTIQENAKQ